MSKQEIDNFLAEKQIAFVGISRNKAKYSNKVFEKFTAAGHEMHPVHPVMESINGVACVQSVQQLPGDVRALVVIARPSVCISVLKDVSATHISHIWIFSGNSSHSNVDAEIERLRGAGVATIFGFCPFMFLEPVNSIHALHRFFASLFGAYPKN